MKYIYIVLVSVLCLQTIQAQDITPVDSVVLDSGHIVGRWGEKSRFDNEGNATPTQPYTYIFKNDKVFHRGTTTNDVLIFNVTGRFNVQNDLIVLSYKDYLNRRPGVNKEQQMTLRILVWGEEQMTAIVNEPHTQEYVIVLSKQGL